MPLAYLTPYNKVPLILAEHLLSVPRHDCILLPNGEDILVFGGTIFSAIYNVPSGRSLYGIDTVLSRDHGRAVEVNGGGDGRGRRRILVLGGESLTNRVEEFIPGMQVGLGTITEHTLGGVSFAVSIYSQLFCVGTIVEWYANRPNSAWAGGNMAQ